MLHVEAFKDNLNNTSKVLFNGGAYAVVTSKHQHHACPVHIAGAVHWCTSSMTWRSSFTISDPVIETLHEAARPPSREAMGKRCDELALGTAL